MPLALDSLRSNSRLLVAGLTLGVLSTTAFLSLRNLGLFNGSLEKRAKLKLIQEVTEEIEKALPFLQVTSLNFSARIADVRQGKLRTVELHFQERKVGGIKGVLRGTVDLDFPEGFPTRAGGVWKIRADLETEVREIPAIGHWRGAPQLQLEFDRAWRIQRGTVDLRQNEESFEPLSLKIRKPELHARLEGARWEAHLQAKGLEWKGTPSDQRIIQAGAVQIELHGSAGPQGPYPLEIHLQSAGGELLWDDRYLDLPLKGLPFHAQLEGPERGQFTAGPTSEPAILRLDWRPLFPDSVPPGKKQALKTSFRVTPKATLEKWIQPFLSWPELKPLRGWKLRGGLLRASGDFAASLEGKISERFEHAYHSLNGHLEVRALSGDSSEYGVHWENAELNAPLELLDSSRSQQQTVRIALPDFRWRRLQGSLKPSFVSIQHDSGQSRFRVDSLSRTLSFPALADLPWKIRPIAGKRTQDGWEIDGGFGIQNLTLSRALRLACLHPSRLPETRIGIRFPKLTLSTESFETEGEIEAQSLGGLLRLSEIAIYNPFAAVPETQLDLDLKGVSLREFGRYIHLGEMEGELRASAQNLVLQGTLPTQFDARIEALPQNSSPVTFSIDALRNFVKVMANLDSLPGIANWMAFGPPARLLGSYRLDFAGLSLRSEDGVIELRSHTPAALLAKEGGKHFILYSSRFKMPLQSRTYPVRVDAPAMANFIARVSRQIEALGEAEKQKVTEQPHAKGTVRHDETLGSKTPSVSSLDLSEGADSEDAPGCR